MSGVKQEIREIAKPWLNRLGKYKVISENNSIYGLLTAAELKIQDGIIILTGKRVSGRHQKIKCPLTIINDNLAKTSGYGRSAGNKLQILYSKDGMEYLRFHGMDFIKL